MGKNGIALRYYVYVCDNVLHNYHFPIWNFHKIHKGITFFTRQINVNLISSYVNEFTVSRSVKRLWFLWGEKGKRKLVEDKNANTFARFPRLLA